MRLTLYPAATLAALLLSYGVCVMTTPAAEKADDPEEAAKAFIAGHVKRVRPLEVTGNEAWWVASTTGSKEAFAKKTDAQNKLDAALSDAKVFAELKKLHAARGKFADKVTARSLEVLYYQYLEKQVEPKLLQQMVEKANAIEETFNKFRAKADGKELTDNEVRDVLKKSNDSKRLQEVWQSCKAVGGEVEKDLKELVALRNKAAKELGFANFHEMTLTLNEQEGKKLVALFDELDKLTREPFTKAKAEIDAKLAKRYGVKVDELMPWHYHDPFFQETPKIFESDIDEPYRAADILKVCREFYAGIGLPIDRVIARSDLLEKKGKSQHAFCTDIDREGDVRVLANIKPNHQWASTMLHEFGHAVYSSLNGHIPADLPYPVRSEAHILTTEGVAMMFERPASRSSFLQKMGVKVADPAGFDRDAATAMKYQLLIFSRWCQVMLRFEKGMYENPTQDLNKLWWDLVTEYQQLKRPAGRSAPDYGSKIHVVVAPVYYHNYMMGQLFASQVHHAIAKEVYKGADPATIDYVGNKEVGSFMKKKVFGPGRTLDWNALTKHATGAELEAKAFAADFKAK